MRLKQSRPACEEQILRCLNDGYETSHALYVDYMSKRNLNQFDEAVDVASYGGQLNDWLNVTHRTLLDLFPTSLEATSVRLNVEQNQLLVAVGLFFAGLIGPQGAPQLGFLENGHRVNL